MFVQRGDASGALRLYQDVVSVKMGGNDVIRGEQNRSQYEGHHC